MKVYLQAKLRAPHLPRKHIPRPQVSAKIELGQHYPLTYLCAPAGYAKTTALVEWSRASHEKKIGWYRLDSFDDEPHQFWGYFYQAIHTCLQELPEPSLVSETISPSHLINALLEALHLNQQSISLIIDDYHHIKNTAIHESLQRFLQYCPSRFHVLLSTRHDLSSTALFSNDKIRSQCLILDQNILKFSQTEAQAFLHQSSSPLLKDQEKALIARLEGWPLGFHLIQQGLQESLPTQTDPYHLINHFLLTQLISSLTVEHQDFLYAISVAEEFDLTFAQTLMPSLSIQQWEMLVQDLSTKGFIIALENETYRFPDFLRLALQDPLHKNSVAWRKQHERAGQWYLDKENPLKALECFIQSKAWTKVESILAQVAPRFIEQSQSHRIYPFFVRLPKRRLLKHPQLFFDYGSILLEEYRYPQAKSWILKVEKYYEKEISALEIHGKIWLLKAGYTLLADDHHTPQDTINAITQALIYLESDHSLTPLIYKTLGTAYIQSFNLPKGIQAFQEAAQWSHQHQRFIELIDTYHILHFPLFYAGRYQEAETYLLQALHMIEQSGLNNTGMDAWCYTQLARLKQTQGDTKDCDYYIDRALEQVKNTGQDMIALTEICRIHLRNSDFEAYHKLLQLLKHHINQASSPQSFTALLPALEDDYAIYKGEWKQPNVWLTKEKPTLSTLTSSGYDHFIRTVYWLFAQHNYTQAVALIDKHLITFQDNHIDGLLLELQALRAFALYCLCKFEKSISVFDETLQLAERLNSIHWIVGLACDFSPLIDQSSPEQANIDPTFFSHLVQRTQSKFTHPFKVSHQHHLKLKDLSQREQEILELILAHKSNLEISEALFISVNTLKTHIRNLYRKLGISGREEALNLFWA